MCEISKGRIFNPANSRTMVKQEPYVGEDGIYEPIDAYVPEGTASLYKMIISKEMFIEAYNKWIKGEN